MTGTTPAGERIEARGCDFYTFRDGKVVKKDLFWKIVEKMISSVASFSDEFTSHCGYRAANSSSKAFDPQVRGYRSR